MHFYVSSCAFVKSMTKTISTLCPTVNAIITSTRWKFCGDDMKKLLQQQRKIILFLHIFFYLYRLVETNCICLISFWVKNQQGRKVRDNCFTLPSGEMFLSSFQIIKLLLLTKILNSF